MTENLAEKIEERARFLSDKIEAVGKEVNNATTESRVQNAEMRAKMETVTLAVGEIKAHVSIQNGRVGKLEDELGAMKTTAEAKKLWDEEQTRRNRWFFGIAIAGAGVVSGIVFQAISTLNL